MIKKAKPNNFEEPPTDEEDDTLRSNFVFMAQIIQSFSKDFQAPSLEQDEGPRGIGHKDTNKDNENIDDEIENDESHPLLKETEFGATPVPKALKRQRR